MQCICARKLSVFRAKRGPTFGGHLCFLLWTFSFANTGTRHPPWYINITVTSHPQIEFPLCKGGAKVRKLSINDVYSRLMAEEHLVPYFLSALVNNSYSILYYNTKKGARRDGVLL